MTDIWVITWKYGDNSGAGVVRAYEHESQCDIDFNMLKEQSSSRLFEKVKVQMIGDYE